jgi:hypothetical protein
MTLTAGPGFGHGSAADTGGQRANRLERIINAIAAGASGAVVFVVTSGIAFVIFVALWIAFGAGLIWNQGSIDAAWQWMRDLPLLIEAVVWLLFLPVVLGLWVWETAWPLILRLALVAGLAGWSVMIFLPRGLLGARS